MTATARLPCPDCAALGNQDALAVKTVEIVGTFYNPCAPVNQYTCRCRACGQQWVATEVYDETEQTPPVWSWERDSAAP